MRHIKYSSFLGIVLGAVLAASPASYAQTVIIPLEQSAEAPEEAQGPSVTQSSSVSQGPSALQESASSQTQSTGPSAAADSQSIESAKAAVEKPVIASQGGIVMDGASGTVLFGQNENTQYYPASITKLMTALLTAENCSLDEVVTFSATATTNLESGAVSLGLTEGDQLTVEQCLYALLLKSANEVGNALAEHIAGSNAQFADMMNAKAASLGCQGTHFTNPHGLNDSNHYTTPYDMALIARAAFENPVVSKVASTLTYTLPATKNSGARTLTMGHKMLNPANSQYYPGIIGGKTGYTSKAGNTLVTVAQRDGIRLVAVVMKSQSTHYADTKALLDYGFQVMEQAKGSAQETVQTEQSQGGSGGPGVASANAGWHQEGDRWYYIQGNGLRASGQWLTIDGEDYWFDSDGYMANGWRQLDGKWYYLRSSGAMARDYWVEKDGKYYYLGSDGALLVSTTTPDGYPVDAEGAWIQS